MGGKHERLGQEILRLGRAQHAVQPVADPEMVRRQRLHRVEDQLIGPGHEPAHMARLAMGCLGQHRDGKRLGDKPVQPLACPVPVDQEDDARAETLEGRVGRREIGAMNRAAPTT